MYTYMMQKCDVAYTYITEVESVACTDRQFINQCYLEDYVRLLWNLLSNLFM